MEGGAEQVLRLSPRIEKTEILSVSVDTWVHRFVLCLIYCINTLETSRKYIPRMDAVSITAASRREDYYTSKALEVNTLCKCRKFAQDGTRL